MMIRWPYLLVWSFLVTTITCHRVIESVESEESQNTTALYPVTEANLTNRSRSEERDATSWKIEAAFAESKLPEIKDNQTESKESKESKDEKSGNCSKEFRPSPPLGIIEEERPQHIPGTLDNFVPIKKPASGFHSFHHGPTKSGLHTPPKEVFRQQDFPYKIESSIFTRAKGGWSTQVSKPTVESPVKVPAGGLYSSPHAFKDKPGVDGHDDNFGLEFNRDIKGSEGGSGEIKKRINPWMNLLRMVTAFIPVGLIISALTPSVITIENSDLDNYKYSPLIRRSTSSALANISEPCRRRLLCELHSERNYMEGQKYRRRGKLCYKLPCEDPEALARTLQWLLSYHHGDNDGRG
ncbi:uncharacterized protein LOC128674000 isoform X2 [Plodia interpunctella]|uniref:uncharacterized protein LOC128674000 isoform X2 n=1 Tax=Plodia interpunctella TaxID=58824 RepID=UPI002368F2C8|nr:uncharacterized protein LOC128674000 isoform X2 [Plodia interpunctella]